ncbi:MAG: hypothetical protein ACPGTP_01680 [Bacteroidia bacterium]
MRSFLLIAFQLLLLPVFAQINYVTIDDKGNPNEPSVAIHPQNGKIISASNVDNFYTTSNLITTKQKATSKYGVYGDPVLHYMDTTLFYTHLSKTKGKEYGDWFDRIVVQKIESISPWSETSYSVGYNNGKMQDKPWVSSDISSKKHAGNLYVTWTEFDKYGSSDPNDFSRIRFSKLGKDSDSFSEAITISDSTGNCLDGDNTLEGATTAIGPNGEIYAVWSGHDKIWFDKSVDGGLTWSKDRIIANQPNGWDMEMPYIGRANGMPFIKCDKKRNILYMCWADEKNDNADIWLKYSKNEGETWSKRIQVSQDYNVNHQYFPNLEIDPQSGTVFIAYYDQKYSDQNRFYDISISSYDISRKEPLSISTITRQSIPLPGEKVFYGDYIDIDIKRDSLAVIYTTYYNQTVAVELAVGNVTEFLTSKNDNREPFSLSEDNFSQTDSISYYLNITQTGKIKTKLKVGSFPFRNIHAKTFRINDAFVNKDYLLFTVKKGKPYHLKYKIRSTPDKNKYHHSVRKKTQ